MSLPLVHIKLNVGELYGIGFHYEKLTLCIFEKVTEKGYNFVIVNSGERYLKHNLYIHKPTGNFLILNKISITQSFKYNKLWIEHKQYLRMIKIKKIVNKNEAHNK